MPRSSRCDKQALPVSRDIVDDETVVERILVGISTGHLGAVDLLTVYQHILVSVIPTPVSSGNISPTTVLR
jgi:hypothetical protein